MTINNKNLNKIKKVKGTESLKKTRLSGDLSHANKYKREAISRFKMSP
jgi:hypothetical protein